MTRRSCENGSARMCVRIIRACVYTCADASTRGKYVLVIISYPKDFSYLRRPESPTHDEGTLLQCPGLIVFSCIEIV